MNPPEISSLFGGLTRVRIRDDTSLWSGYSTSYGLTFTSRGAFDFWYRGRVWTQGPTEVKLKEPGEVHRDLYVHAPVSAESLSIPPALIERTASELGVASVPHFQRVL